MRHCNSSRTELKRQPGNVRPLISKATHYYYYREDLPEALKCIDVAIEQAFRTKFFVREALGNKARIFLDLGGRGEELGQVLEQIMSLDTYREIPDIGKERDFVDRAPPGLIREDIVARYNIFCPNSDRARELYDWIDRQERELPIAEAIDRVQARLKDANDRDKFMLTFRLQALLADAGRYDEALRLLDGAIEQSSNNVSFPSAKATLYLEHLNEPHKALECVEVALERAFRTKFSRRGALGVKARILLKLGRDEELGQVLEQIMSLQMFPEITDVGRERDFVDAAPTGLISEDVVARYNEFCPKLDDDS